MTSYDIHAIDRLYLTDLCLKELCVESSSDNLKAAQGFYTDELRKMGSKLGWDDEAVKAEAFKLIKEGFGLNI